MHKPQSTPPAFLALSRLFAAMAFAVLAGCAVNPPQPGTAHEEAQDESDADAPQGEGQAGPAEPENRSAYPKEELTEETLYEFLLAEIAGQRGNVALSAQAYVDLAKRTRDPRIARRATEIALYAWMNNAAIEAATIWHEADPASTRALQSLAGMLVSVGRYDEAVPYLKKLLAGSAGEAANGFAQLPRMLANAQDKRAALVLMQNLAADHAALPEAHVAVARVAMGAGDDRVALDEVRKARQLRPEWEAAVLLEAQLLQKSSADQAAKVLDDYLRKYPTAREARLAHARILVAQRQFDEARAEFRKLM